MQPAARLAAFVAGDEEFQQAVGRQALIVGRGRNRVGARLCGPRRPELDVHAGPVAKADVGRQPQHQAADRGRHGLGGEHDRERLDRRGRRCVRRAHGAVGPDHERRRQRPALADQALAGRLLLLGDRKAHHPAMVDLAFQHRRLAGAAGAAPAVVRQAEPGHEPRVQDQFALRALEALAGVRDRHPTGTCRLLLHPAIPRPRGASSSRNSWTARPVLR